jgi:fumarylpyruvate hydrolase
LIDFVVDPPEQVSLAIKGTDARSPVRRIYCVGRNYADHAKEMGFDPKFDPPFFFLKPADTELQPGSPFPYPPRSNNVYHEVELVVALGAGGANIRVADARKHIFGYTIGSDMTRRDLQLSARDKGRPRDVGKGFDHCALLGTLVLVAACGYLERGSHLA